MPEPMFAWQLLVREGVLAVIQRDLQAAEQWATQAFQTGTASGQQSVFDMFAVQLFNVRYQQGRAGSAR